jgi:hypothetical protein
MKIVLLVAVLGLTACEREKSVGDPVSHSDNPPEQTARELPEAFEALVTGIIDAMPEEGKAEIRAAQSAEMMVDHFGMGMALRNGELNQRDSEVLSYLTRNGIHHRDDLSSIVLLSVNRRLRGEPIELTKQIQYYRDYWKEQDVVAPLDVKCPTCGVDMEIINIGGGVSDDHPERVYFLGRCSEHSYLYYHADGWRPEEAVWSGPKSKGEQDGTGQPATRPESKSEDIQNHQPEAEGRSR